MNKETWAGIIVLVALLILFILAVTQPAHAITLGWTMPPDPDPYLRVSLWAVKEGTRDTVWLGLIDSLRSGAPESTHVNVGCIPVVERWTFGAHVLSYKPTRPPSGPSNTVTSFFLP